MIWIRRISSVPLFNTIPITSPEEIAENVLSVPSLVVTTVPVGIS